MRLKIEIELDNAALVDDRGDGVDGEALAKVLQRIADNVATDQSHGSAWDYNGNKVGKWSLES